MVNKTKISGLDAYSNKMGKSNVGEESSLGMLNRKINIKLKSTSMESIKVS